MSSNLRAKCRSEGLFHTQLKLFEENADLQQWRTSWEK